MSNINASAFLLSFDSANLKDREVNEDELEGREVIEFDINLKGGQTCNGYIPLLNVISYSPLRILTWFPTTTKSFSWKCRKHTRNPETLTSGSGGSPAIRKKLALRGPVGKLK